MYTAQQIADYFITISEEESFVDEKGETISEPITNLKIQKILYFAQAAFLSTGRGPLFRDSIQAWKYGPVVEDVYHAFKQNKYGVISSEDRKTTDFSFIKDEDKEVLNSVWESFGKFSAKKLVDITHEHAPWKSTYKDGVPGLVITQDSIQKYYQGMFE